MKANFKTGDRVRALKGVDESLIRVGDHGTVIEESMSPYVEWDNPVETNNYGSIWAAAEDNLELVEEIS